MSKVSFCQIFVNYIPYCYSYKLHSLNCCLSPPNPLDTQQNNIFNFLSSSWPIIVSITYCCMSWVLLPCYFFFDLFSACIWSHSLTIYPKLPLFHPNIYLFFTLKMVGSFTNSTTNILFTTSFLDFIPLTNIIFINRFCFFQLNFFLYSQLFLHIVQFPLPEGCQNFFIFLT